MNEKCNRKTDHDKYSVHVHVHVRHRILISDKMKALQLRSAITIYVICAIAHSRRTDVMYVHTPDAVGFAALAVHFRQRERRRAQALMLQVATDVRAIAR